MQLSILLLFTLPYLFLKMSSIVKWQNSYIIILSLFMLTINRFKIKFLILSFYKIMISAFVLRKNEIIKANWLHIYYLQVVLRLLHLHLLLINKNIYFLYLKTFSWVVLVYPQLPFGSINDLKLKNWNINS